jgi:exopolysaccharide biosynthesis protein
VGEGEIMDIISIILSFLHAFFGSIPPGQERKIVSPTPPQYVQKTVSHDLKEYGYSFIGPIEPERISLHSNLPGKKTSAELMKEHSCTYLVNGGFYTKENTHLGLFLTDGNTLQDQIKSDLFNAFIAKTKTQKLTIKNTPPQEELFFALQSGPKLLDGRQLQILRLSKDEFARRIAAGLDASGSAYFFTVYARENTYSGPYLSDLPEILQKIARVQAINLVHAINLDGGNHSAFYGDNAIFQELSPIGSFFCIV